MTRTLSRLVAAILVGALTVSPTAAWANPPQGERPWAAGVPKERQDKAIALFSEGTAHLKDAYFMRAVDRLREALILWDHPAIHFNLAKALMNLDQPVDAYRHLESAMRYGGAPLEPNQVAQVANLKEQLMTTELAEVSVKVSEPGAALSINGAEVFKGPGTWTGLVKAGKAVVLATKDGFKPNQVSDTFKAGTKPALELTLTKIDLNVRYTRAMAVWKPWTVVGAGVLGLVGGVVMNSLAVESYKAYDASVADCALDARMSATDLGVTLDDGTLIPFTQCDASNTGIKVDARDRGDMLQNVAIAAYAAGGVTLATGLVLLYVNREKLVQGTGSTSVTVAPTLAPGSAGLSATVTF
jgi:hypothetical protein